MNILSNIFNKKPKKSDDLLLSEFLRRKKEILEKEMDAVMFKYLLDFRKFAIKLEKKKRSPIKSWISRDLEIDQERRMKEEVEENALPHPIEKK